MQDAMCDAVMVGMSSAMGWTWLGIPGGESRRHWVCAACGYQGEPVLQRWKRQACAVCGEKRLVPTDSPMAAGYWQSRPPQRKAVLELPQQPGSC